MTSFEFPLGPFSFGDAMVVCRGVPELEDFEQPMAWLLWMQRNLYWYIGDLFILGENVYGDDIFQAIDMSFSPELIQRCVAMSKAFPQEKRNPHLSWSHHSAVLPVKNMELRVLLLKKAQEEQWNSQDFAKYLRTNWKKGMTLPKSDTSQGNDIVG